MMDFGAVDLEGMVGPESIPSFQPVSNPNSKATKPKSNGSGFLKKGRSDGSSEEDWRSSKVAKTDHDSEPPKTMLGNPLLLRSNSLLSGDHSDKNQNMISFSSPKSEVTFLSKNGGLAERRNQNSAFPNHQHSPYAHPRNAGYGSGGMNAGMHAALPGAKGSFTPSQWVELEHQALIYKYIVANVPVPSNLLIPLKSSLYPFGFSGLSSGSYAPNSLGWGSSFHFGFSGNTDTEPGRCRRTDGKKWRCSKDAVADQKYCEKHLNRNRHRSRKPVEGHTTGQFAVTGISSATKVAPIACATSASVMPTRGVSNSLDMTHQPFKGLQSGAEKPNADVLVDRMQDHKGLSVVSPATNAKPKDYPFSIPKPHIPIEELSNSGFGLVSSDSLLNPSRNSSYTSSRNYNSILDFNDHESRDQHPLRHFIDDWPKDQSNRATIAWPKELKSDWTQLSMSIPVAASDFSSTSSSSPHEKITLSPLRESHELDPIQMGLTVNNHLSESTEKQTNWVPVSWGNAMGGPLGEVLNSSSSCVGAAFNKSVLNHTNGAWNGSPRMGSSPTGELQRMNFVSLSNSSSGSNTPRAHNKQTDETGNRGDDMIGSTLASSFSIPLL